MAKNSQDSQDELNGPSLDPLPQFRGDKEAYIAQKIVFLHLSLNKISHTSSPNVPRTLVDG